MGKKNDKKDKQQIVVAENHGEVVLFDRSWYDRAEWSA